MRKAVLALTILIIAGVAVVFIVLRLTRKPTPTPIGWRAHVTTLAGDGSPKFFSDPFGITVAKDGTIYVADAGENNLIRKIGPDGTITALTATLDTPSALAIDTNGSLYVA